MKTVETQLAQYKSVHLNPNNITTHFIGVPLIILAATLLFNTISIEIHIEDLLNTPFTLHITLAMGIFALIFLYYIALHRLLAVGMLVYIIINLLTAELLSHNDNIIQIALALFIIGWIFQLVGHYYEQAKPAFIDDLNQFLIGPFFLMAELYFLMGFIPKLEEKVNELAVEKRLTLDSKK